MEVVDIFLEKSKDKFLNQIIKIPKEYDWYLGILINTNNSNKEEFEKMNVFLKEKCDLIYQKSEKHLKLLKIMLVDDFTLLLFGTDPIQYDNNIKGIIKSICKYLNCKIYEVNYIRYFREMIFDAWGEQQYFYLIDNGKAYNLRGLKDC